MGFPFTANGVVYTLADFQNNGYAEKLAPFLSDLMEESANAYPRFCTTNESMNMNPGTNTMTVNEPGMTFILGQVVFITNALNKLYMVARVTGWNSGTSALSVNVEAVSVTDFELYDSWIISSGQWAEPQAAVLGLAQGGTGVATAALARDSAMFPRPETSACEIFEDFIGYKREITALTVLSAEESMYKTVVVGQGKIIPEFHTTESAVKFDDLHRHPGVAELSVSNSGDVAAICLGDYGQFPYGNTELAQLKIGFFIPEPRDNINDLWTFRLGWLKNHVITSFGSVDSIMTLSGATDFYGTSVGNSITIGSRTILRAEDCTASTQQTALGVNTTLPMGKWFYAQFLTNGSNEVMIIVSDEFGAYYEEFFFTVASPDSDASAGTPFVFIQKTTGTQTRRIYVDYIWAQMPQWLTR